MLEDLEDEPYVRWSGRRAIPGRASIPARSLGETPPRVPLRQCGPGDRTVKMRGSWLGSDLLSWRFPLLLLLRCPPLLFPPLYAFSFPPPPPPLPLPVLLLFLLRLLILFSSLVLCTCGIRGVRRQVPMANVKISFLPVKPPAELATKGKYKRKMNVVYFSNGCAQMMTPEVVRGVDPFDASITHPCSQRGRVVFVFGAARRATHRVNLSPFPRHRFPLSRASVRSLSPASSVRRLASGARTHHTCHLPHPHPPPTNTLAFSVVLRLFFGDRGSGTWF